MSAVAPARRWRISTGTMLVLGLGLVLLAGWFAYQPMIPPVWLHALAADIALRAAADPDAALPEDSRQASPRGLADSPYICVARAVTLPWDRLVAVTKHQDLRSHPILAQAVWLKGDLDKYVATMARDERYQLLVLLKDNAVVDAQMFFTFWGNLDGIARTEGFTPEQAIFTAASQGGIYVVTAVHDAPADTCRSPD